MSDSDATNNNSELENDENIENRHIGVDMPVTLNSVLLPVPSVNPPSLSAAVLSTSTNSELQPATASNDDTSPSPDDVSSSETRGDTQPKTETSGGTQSQTMNNGNTQSQNETNGDMQTQTLNNEGTQCQTDTRGTTQSLIETSDNTHSQTETSGNNQLITGTLGDMQLLTANFSDSQTENSGNTQSNTETNGDRQFQTENSGDTQSETKTSADTQFVTETSDNTQSQTNTSENNQFLAETNADMQLLSINYGDAQFLNETCCVKQFLTKTSGETQSETATIGDTQSHTTTSRDTQLLNMAHGDTYLLTNTCDDAQFLTDTRSDTQSLTETSCNTSLSSHAVLSSAAVSGASSVLFCDKSTSTEGASSVLFCDKSTSTEGNSMADTPSITATRSDTLSPSDAALLTATNGATPSLKRDRSDTPSITPSHPNDVSSELNEVDLDHVGGNVYYYNKSEAILGHRAQPIVYAGKFGQNKNINIAVKRIKFSTNKDAVDAQNELKSIYDKIDKKTKREVDILEGIKHPNIVEYKDSYIHASVLYIAFEMARGTLADYVEESNESWRQKLKPIQVNRGVAHGLEYVHSIGIVHRDLKPSNIFIIQDYQGLKPVIGDFGSAKATHFALYSQSGRTGTSGFIAPEIWKAFCKSPNEPNERKYTIKSDIFSEGIVFFYTLSLGCNPFGFEHDAQSEIKIGKSPNFDKIDQNRNTIAHKSLLISMLHADPAKRPDANDVFSHPAMWKEKKILKYLSGVSDKINKNEIDSSLFQKLEDTSILPNDNWMSNLPPITKEYLQNYPIGKKWSMYSGKERLVCKGLLRAIRNTNSHGPIDYPQNIRDEIGDYPEGYVDMWLKVCPKLLMHVYEILRP